MTESSMGRRNLVRGAGLGLAASVAGVGLAAPAAFAQDDVVTKGKADVQKAYDDAKAEVEKLGADINDDTRGAYDALVKSLDEIQAKLDDAGTKTGADAKRAYRDIQHEFRDFDRQIDRVADEADDKAEDAWHDVRDALGKAHDEFDHLLDGL